MKFGIAKLPKTFYKNTKKKLRRKKNNKELASFEDRNINTNFCYSGRKSFGTWQVQCHCYRGPGGPYPPSSLTKIRFLEHHVRSRKLTMMQKGIITFNLIYLIKVTFISSILKFSKTESLVVQVSNTTFSIQSLHL